MKKGLKKVFAVGASAAVASLTLVGAFAYDLSDYPAPFVEDGVFNGGIVVGESAATSDVLGSIDIAASLQAAAKNVVSDGSSATATTVVEGGVLLQDGDNQDVNFGDTIGSTLDDQDLDILEEETLKHDDGSETDFTQEITISDTSLEFDNPNTDVYDEPIVYMDFDTADTVINYTIDFEDAVNFTDYENSESFTMFGKSFTIKDIDSVDEDLILYASDETVLVEMGSSVEYDGHTIDIMGANSDGSIVHISVDGETRSLTEGDNKIVGGLEIYVQEVFISNVAGESAAAKIFLGSDEFDLRTGSGQNLYVDDEKVDGVRAYISEGSNWGDTGAITFEVEPQRIDNDDLGERYEWLAVGDSFVDPVFDFSLDFTEMVPGLKENKGLVELDAGSNDVELTFTNMLGDEYSFEVYKWDEVASNVTFADDFVNAATATTLSEGNMFIATENPSSSEPRSIVLEVDSVYNQTVPKVDFRDISTGKVYTVKDGEQIASTNVDIDASGIDTTAYTVTLTLTDTEYDGLTLVNEENVEIALPEAVGNWSADEAKNITFTEDSNGINFDEAGISTSFNLSFQYVEGTDDEFQLSGFDIANEVDDEAGTVYYALTNYGTFTERDDDKTWAKVYTPAEEADFNIYVAPPTATITTMESAGAGYAVNPIALGLGLLDVDATLGAKPMIVVGGPSVNDIAAELMGNPTMDEIYETFQEGKSMIKWYETEQAMLVAGFNAEDTRAASYVLAEYNDYAEEFSGSEMEVKTSEVSQVVVN